MHIMCYPFRRKEDLKIANKNHTFDQNKYIQDYMKKTYVRISVLLNKKSDADIINYLDKQKNKNQYIKNLIRKDIH